MDDVDASDEVRDVVLLFTDGLIERRGEVIGAGLDRLAAVLGAGPDGPAEAVVTHTVDALLADRRRDDDLAVVGIVVEAYLRGRHRRSHVRRSVLPSAMLGRCCSP